MVRARQRETFGKGAKVTIGKRRRKTDREEGGGGVRMKRPRDEDRGRNKNKDDQIATEKDGRKDRPDRGGGRRRNPRAEGPRRMGGGAEGDRPAAGRRGEEAWFRGLQAPPPGPQAPSVHTSTKLWMASR